MRATTAPHREFFTLLLLTGAAVSAAYLLSHTRGNQALWLVVALAIGVVAFLRTQMAIMLLIAAMLLSPEFTVGQTSDASMARGVTLRLDDFMMVVVGLAWFLKTALYKELNLLQATPLNIPALLYALSCLVPTLVGMQAGRVDVTTGSLFVLKYLEYLLIYWMVVNNTTSERQLRQYLLVLFAVAVVVSCMAILQIPSGERVSAPFEGDKGEPNTLGGYLLFIMALLLGIGCAGGYYWKTALVTAGFLFLPFLYTLSRSSYLAFLPMLGMVVVLTRRHVLILLMVLLTLVFFTFPSLLPRAVINRIGYTLEQSQQKGQVVILGHRLDTSTSARLESFSLSWEAFKEKPVLGWGVTGWHFIDSQYPRQLVETGMVGFCAFLFLIGTVLRIGWLSRKRLSVRQTHYFGLACGFIAGTIGLLVHSWGANSFIIVRIMEPFWLVCALVFLLPQLVEKTTQPIIGDARRL